MARDTHLMTESVPVRITKKRYKELRRIAKANGHTISWLMNYALDLYFQSLNDSQPKFQPPAGAFPGQSTEQGA